MQQIDIFLDVFSAYYPTVKFDQPCVLEYSPEVSAPKTICSWRQKHRSHCSYHCTALPQAWLLLNASLMYLRKASRQLYSQSNVSPYRVRGFIRLTLSMVRFTAESMREIRVKHEPGLRHCIFSLISPLLGSGISEIQWIIEHRGIIFT